MRRYEIWSEGYAATGEHGTAVFLGSAEGKTFGDACVNFACENSGFSKHFGQAQLTYWGCRLFDNEIGARKSFG
ncbi:hypothetical protein LCGC14_1100940 [marine sediment metagenome]|uniref:Uncharacterized protein n=1 Tax=marine sediment metagenome TaxID=412755 RepID=A0A0F9MX98_9ZZZZ